MKYTNIDMNSERYMTLYRVSKYQYHIYYISKYSFFSYYRELYIQK